MDSGDFFGQAGDQDSLKSEYMVQAMDRLGYDVVTLGEREFNFGQSFLLGTFKKTKIDVVSSNLVYADTKKPFVKPYVIRKMCNVRVAFFGLIGTDVKIRTLASERALEVKDPIAAAKALVPELRKKADIVVLLSHIGLTEGQRLTLEVPGVDVMVFGHQPGLFREITKTNGVINTRSGERGQYIPGIHLVVEDGKLTSYDGDVVTLDDKVPADEEMNKAVDTFNDEMNRRFSAAPAANSNSSTPPPVALAADHFLGEKNCRRCHEAEYQMYSSQQHAKAFATLTKNQRDSSPECLPCHVVGYGQPGGFANKTATPDLVNVQCENCHGMGTNHPSKDATAVVGPDVCLTCHTHEQNPNFDYDEALTHIVHWHQ
ncbi:MAG TPA: multiheme c-type cytochrome [Candidatus Saccharimonadales bacterium]|nr:multiheme c-type cytochrome [Candidatus Saccharimonadales bacterium]